MTTAGGLTFATTHGVIDGVHDHTADRGPPAHVALATGRTELDILMLEIADLADDRVAHGENLAVLSRGQLDSRVLVITGHDFSQSSGRTGHLGAATGLKLNAMDHGSQRHLLQRQGIAHFNGGIRPGQDGLADLEILGSEDVTALAVDVLEQSDTCRTIRIVFNGFHDGGNADAVTLEIDLAKQTLDATAAMTAGDAALSVTATRDALAKRKRLVRGVSGDLRKVRYGLGAKDRSQRIKRLNGHGSDSLQTLDGLALFEADEGFLPVVAPASALAHALELAGNVRGPNIQHLDPEGLGDGVSDLELGSAGGNFESVEAALVTLHRRLFRDERAADDFTYVLHAFPRTTRDSMAP